MIGEFFGATHDFEYNIGDKLYEFAIMSYEDFDKLKTIYTQLIELVCTAKESNTMDEKLDCFFKMFQIVRACLEFSPYTHFYTQVLIDIIVKTYNSKVFRTDLLFKSQIGVFIENPKYYAKEFYEDLEENTYTIELILHEFTDNIEKVSTKKHNEYIKYFETIRDLLIENLMEKKTDLKKRIELISKYSNNSIVRNLSTEERLYLYEAKRVFDIHYLNTNPAHAIFLDTKFKTKYVCNKGLSLQERRLDVDDVVKLIIGALNKQKEKVQNSSILKEYNREYKRMHGLHYNHTKKFKEKQFKEWSEKARELRDTYTNEQIEDFKIELKKLSDLYWK